MTATGIMFLLLGGLFLALGVSDVIAAHWWGWLGLGGGLLVLLGGIRTARRRP